MLLCIVSRFTGSVSRPNRYQLNTSLEYETEVPSSSATDVKLAIEIKLSNTDCFSKELCQVDVALDSGSRRRRDTGSVLQITFEVVPGNDGELMVDEYVNTGNGETCIYFLRLSLYR